MSLKWYNASMKILSGGYIFFDVDNNFRKRKYLDTLVCEIHKIKGAVGSIQRGTFPFIFNAEVPYVILRQDKRSTTILVNY